MTKESSTFRLEPRTKLLLSAIGKRILPGVELDRTKVIEHLAEKAAIELGIKMPPVKKGKP
jgi:hypothetical protein